MDYQIWLTESAKKDIAYFEASEQRVIVAGIISHLKTDAETRQERRSNADPIQSLRGNSDLIGSEFSIRLEMAAILKLSP